MVASVRDARLRRLRIRSRIHRLRNRAALLPYAAMLSGSSHSLPAADAGPVTDALYESLDATDLAAIEASLSPAETALVAATDGDIQRRRHLLHLGVHHGIPNVLAKTRLSQASPPDDVHAMSRGPLAAGGSLWYADMVVDSLARAGTPTQPRRILDFGASSGRVARVLRAYWPEATIMGCDPNLKAVAWANDNLPGLEFFKSATSPPLDCEPGAFDLVYAISIWSHYGRSLAVAWLDEMHRVVRPGGVLLLTFHGLHSLAYYRQEGLRDREYLARAAKDWVRDGFHFAPVFGTAGDWGVQHEDWGEAYMSLDWLVSRASPKWALLYHAMGVIEGNQDVAVLSRRET